MGDTEKWYMKNGEFSTMKIFKPISMTELEDIIPFIDVHEANDFTQPFIGGPWCSIHAQGSFIHFHLGKIFTGISDFSKIIHVNRGNDIIIFEPKNSNVFSLLETHLKKMLKTTNLFKRPFYSQLLDDLEESNKSIIFIERNGIPPEGLPVEIDEKTKIRVKLGKKEFIKKRKWDLKKGDLCGLKLLLDGIIISNRTIKVIITAKSILLHRNTDNRICKCSYALQPDFKYCPLCAREAPQELFTKYQ